MKKKNFKYGERGTAPYPLKTKPQGKMQVSDEEESEQQQEMPTIQKLEPGTKVKLLQLKGLSKQTDLDDIDEDIQESGHALKTMIEQHSSIGMPSWMHDKRDDRDMPAQMIPKKQMTNGLIKRTMQNAFDDEVDSPFDDAQIKAEANRPYKKAVKGLPPTGKALEEYRQKFGEEPEATIEEVEEIYESEDGQPARRIVRTRRSNKSAPKSKSGGWVKKLFDIIK